MRKVINFCKLYPKEMLFAFLALPSIFLAICGAIYFNGYIVVMVIPAIVSVQAILSYIMFKPADNQALLVRMTVWFAYFTLFAISMLLCTYITQKMEIFVALSVVLLGVYFYVQVRINMMFSKKKSFKN